MQRKTMMTFLAVSSLMSSAVMAGPYAPAAGLPGSDAINKDDSSIVSWATGYENYLPGLNVDNSWQTPDKALGVALGNSFDIVSLGTGGQITLTFLDPIVNGQGADFAVFENSINDSFLELARVQVSSDGSNFFSFAAFSLTPSPVSAFGAVDATNISGLAGKYRQGWGTPFDLEQLNGTAGLDINAVSYIRLLDIVGDGSMFDDTAPGEGGPHPIYDPYQTFGSAGFDLDAIAVIHNATSAVPLPASIWLLMTGMISFFTFRKNSISNRIIK